jgi:putative PIN family toxin of toxin-antitoxin system
MRVVLDTNVLVSGLLSASGPPAWIVEAVLAGELELALDMAIRQEYEDVLRRPELAFSARVVDDILAAIDQLGFLVAAAPPCPVPLPDPDDEPFLAVARATDCNLVTGNLKHYPAKSRQGATVLTPRQLVDQLRQGPALS